jgi:hypothetical protein
MTQRQAAGALGLVRETWPLLARFLN